MSGNSRNIGLLILVLALNTAAQQPEITTWYDDSLHPCTHDSVLVTETIDRFPGGGIQRLTLTVLGMSREFAAAPTQLQSREFIKQVLGMAALQCASGSAVNIPVAAAAATFQQTVFTRQAKPRIAMGTPLPLGKAAAPDQSTIPNPAMAPEVSTPAAETSSDPGKAVQLAPAKKETGSRLTLPTNTINTDLELSFFNHKVSSSRNYAVRAGYNRTFADEKVTCGATLIVNTMLMLDRIFFNNALNLNGTYLLSETRSFQRKAGGSLNAFLVDKDFYGTPFGMSIVAHFSDNWFVNGDNIVTYGIMGQQSFVGAIKTTLITAGVLYGLPIGDRFAINFSSLYAVNVLTVGKEGAQKVESPMMAQPGVNGSICFTKLFSIEGGFKTTLLVKDYRDMIVTLGATVLF